LAQAAGSKQVRCSSPNKPCAGRSSWLVVAMGNHFTCTRTLTTGQSARCARSPGPGCSVPDPVVGACGVVGNVFFEPEGSVTTETWQYVGDGQGGYSKVQSYSFVGDGNGNYDKEMSSAGCAGRVRRLCAAFFFVLVLSGVAYVFLPVRGILEQLQPVLAYTTSAPTAEADSASEPPELVAPVVTKSTPRYVCSTGRQKAKLAAIVYSEWISIDSDKSGTVSREELVARKASMPADTFQLLLNSDINGDGSLSREEFSSVLGVSDEMALRNQTQGLDGGTEVESWTLAKRKWCCDHSGVGCGEGRHGKLDEKEGHKSGEFDCQAGIEEWDAQWSQRKQLYCCGQIGCSRRIGGKPYDCEAGFRNWKKGWSSAKKDWCCNHHHKGCPEDTSDVDHDCSKDVTEWSKKWPDEKKAWCCKHRDLGCTPKDNTQLDMRGCDTLCTFQNMEASCKDRIQWSATHMHHGESHACEHAIAEVIGHCSMCAVCSLAEASCKVYNCSADFESWERDWSAEKQAYCCKYEGKGCTTSKRPPPPPPVEGEEYDCEQGLSHWQDAWSALKRDWCCEHKGKGCALQVPDQSSTPQTSDPDFHCDSGLRTWAWGWSREKKEWCCKHEGKGCMNHSLDVSASGSFTATNSAVQQALPQPPLLPA